MRYELLTARRFHALRGIWALFVVSKLLMGKDIMGILGKRKGRSRKGRSRGSRDKEERRKRDGRETEGEK